MSAFMVSTSHIDYLVSAALALDLTTTAEASAMGQMLLDANAISMAARYPKDSDRAPRYTFTPTSRELTRAQIEKAVRCLNYQSCEHEGWEGSDAHSFLESVGFEAVNSNLPVGDKATSSWEVRS